MNQEHYNHFQLVKIFKEEQVLGFTYRCENGVQGKSLGNLYGRPRRSFGLGKITLVDDVKRYTNKTGDSISPLTIYSENEPNTTMKVRQGRKDSSDFTTPFQTV